MRRAFGLAAILLLLVGCATPQEFDGATVRWQSADGQDRVIEAGPCTVSQHYDGYVGRWYTVSTTCTSPSIAP